MTVLWYVVGVVAFVLAILASIGLHELGHMIPAKAFGGKVSYIWATFAVFARWSNNEIEVSVDGEKRHARMHDVIVANGPYIGGGMKIAPDAEPDDGTFDVLLIGDISKRDLVMTMPKIFRGTHLPHARAELLRGAQVSVDAAEPLPIQLDGEQPGTTPARFEVVPRTIPAGTRRFHSRRRTRWWAPYRLPCPASSRFSRSSTSGSAASRKARAPAR